MIGLIVPFAAMIMLATPFDSQTSRWTIQGKSIVWQPKSGDAPHSDAIETSGLATSLLLKYGTKEGGKFFREVRVVWPQLRTVPNDTHGSLQHGFTPEETPEIFVNGQPVEEILVEARLNGLIQFKTTTKDVSVDRTMIASTSGPWVVEDLKITNLTDRELTVELSPVHKEHFTDSKKSLVGQYRIEVAALMPDGPTLRPGAIVHHSIVYRAAGSLDYAKKPAPEVSTEIKARESRVAQLAKIAVLDTPSPEINQMFHMAKIRAVESIFQTKNGKVHSPGGGPYYAAIWANDQAEYSGPLFGMLNDRIAQEAAGTAYDWFAKYMNAEYKPIPSSIIAEGEGFWNGAGDRGDMAMIAYGACRYVLAKGDRAEALKQWPLIAWCLEYLKRQKTPAGVIASDSDELEGRFPAGKANLNTSALTYDALISAAAIAETLGRPGSADYRSWAIELKAAIERHFGAEVEGFNTYRYYEGNTVLRAWICTPLTMGIFDRKAGTLDALFSPRLWTIDGLATQAGEKTFWDRATLYGFRGALQAGETDRVMPFLTEYVQRRTLGEHVPYAIEAWPEGNQRHLSAESALFVRVFTEGLFGIRPMSLNSFEVLPRLPKGWNQMSLKEIWVGGKSVSLFVTRAGSEVNLSVKTSKGEQKFKVGDNPILVRTK